MNSVDQKDRITKIPIKQIQSAKERAIKSQRRIVDILEDDLGLAPETFIKSVGATLFFRTLTMYDLHQLNPAFNLIPYNECLQRGCIALRTQDNDILVALDDPFSPELQTWIEEKIHDKFKWRLVHRSDLVAYLARNEQTLRALDTVRTNEVSVNTVTPGIEDVSLEAIGSETSEVIKLVRSTLRDALKIGASDIHFETTMTGLVIKFRIDGLLSQVKVMQDPQQADQVISRVKVLAELDITERRLPQDGRFKILDHGRNIDIRVSIMPSIFGEDAVLRILDKQSLYQQMEQLTLANLGFTAEEIGLIRYLANEPYGMLLVTGPTGSGKTTTLYAAITEINNGHDKIITIEDPVEYQLPGILQIPVNEKKGLTFARGLRSILRHDPDKIMVGEIRDAETANIAIQSALTGHLVFTTVHANNAFDVIGRFTHMNVDPYSFVSALNGIVAQRLVRLICNHCAESYVPDRALILSSRLTADKIKNYHFRIGRGCRECRGMGYKGRRAIAEILVLNDDIREMITSHQPARKIKEAAHASGAKFLREMALEAVQRGETTLQEINRVTLVA